MKNKRKPKKQNKKLYNAIKNLNLNLEPITQEINTKISFLQKIVQDTRDLSFNPINIEELGL